MKKLLRRVSLGPDPQFAPIADELDGAVPVGPEKGLWAKSTFQTVHHLWVRMPKLVAGTGGDYCQGRLNFLQKWRGR